MKKISSFITGCYLLLLCGCSNAFQQSYTPEMSAEALSDMAVTCQEPHIVRGKFTDETPPRMFKQGFVLMGSSSFSAHDVSTRDLAAFAKEIGACQVLLNQNAVRSVNYAYVQQYTPGMGMYVGRGGWGWGGGVAVYSPGYYSGSYVPYSSVSVDVNATFWARLKEPMVLGVWADRIPDPVRKSLNVEKGAYVLAVRDGSPADMAGIMPEDIITAVNNTPIDSEAAWNTALNENRGRDAVFAMLRAGKALRKTIPLGGRP